MQRHGGTALHTAATAVVEAVGEGEGRLPHQPTQQSRSGGVATVEAREANVTHDPWDGPGHPTVLALCDLGADVNARAFNGSTPLHWAAGAGGVQVPALCGCAASLLQQTHALHLAVPLLLLLLL